MRRMTVLVGAVTALVLVLTGCGSDNPKPSRPASSSASPSASPSAVAPTMPAEAKGTGPEAAKAFVRLFVERLNFAGAHGDTEAFRELFTNGCRACIGVADFIDKTYSNGGEIRGSGWHALTVRAGDIQSKRIKVDALVRVAEQDVIPEASAEPQHFDGAARVMKHFRLAQSEGGWKVAGIESRR